MLVPTLLVAVVTLLAVESRPSGDFVRSNYPKSVNRFLQRAITEGLIRAERELEKNSEHFNGTDWTNDTEVRLRFNQLSCDTNYCDSCIGYQRPDICEDSCEQNCMKDYDDDVQDENEQERNKRGGLIEICLQIDILGLGKLLTGLLGLGGGGGGAGGFLGNIPIIGGLLSSLLGGGAGAQAGAQAGAGGLLGGLPIVGGLLGGGGAGAQAGGGGLLGGIPIVGGLLGGGGAGAQAGGGGLLGGLPIVGGLLGG
ncbi:uncharacterized PE-PGRS family protein PE_PGRS24-like [Physella acuta]|uniref:uncharacterized PE-PGRS family protein PE_PGRS24-like n=1 Tax=Physella acuta TaxID=109671 RepID=UPI0027DB827B|nr:uncharacterized PE-PGRS family protein PE_PGRS24-like [Physella acuta]